MSTAMAAMRMMRNITISDCWRTQSLDQVLHNLESDILPQPLLEDFTSIINKCRKERCRDHILRLYDYLRKRGLDTDRSLGNYVVPMLVEIGSLQDADCVFNKLLSPNEWSWESIMAGHIKSGNLRFALSLYQTKDDTVHLSHHILTSLVKICAKLKDLGTGIRLHAELSRRRLLQIDHHLGSMLVNMYGKCASLREASLVFDQLPCRDVVTWTALISAYVGNRCDREALSCFESMRIEGVHPNSATYVSVLMACGNMETISEGRKIHVQIEKEGLLGADHVGNTLIRMYAKCGFLDIARQVFDKLPVHDVTSWNVLLTGYVEEEYAEEAITCFENMQRYSVCPNAVSYVCALKACGMAGTIEKGELMHTEVERLRFLETNIFVGSALVDMYAKCGCSMKAQQVFEKLPVHDVVSWTSLITGFVNDGFGDKALQYSKQMRQEGVLPNVVTFISCLNACSIVCSLESGVAIHVEVKSQGFLDSDCILGNALLDLYAKCGSLAMAQEVFDKLPIQDVVSWNALIGGYAEYERAVDVLQCFDEMKLKGVPANAVTFLHSLKACSSVDNLDKGQEIHKEIERKGLLQRDLIGNTLINMYAKCGMLSKAQQVFEILSVRDVVSWTAIIAGFAEHVNGERALISFEQMQVEGVTPNAVTLICGLKACGIIGVPEKGQTIHAEIERQGLMGTDIVIGNSLVDMYARCGLFDIAQEVFDKLPIRDVITWNTLITGYAEHGYIEDVLKCFEQMQLQHISPNYVTYVCCLKACTIIGAIDKGNEIHMEIERRGLINKDPIGNTLVNMYSKCGVLIKAQELFDKLPLRDVVTWTALMAGYARIGESFNVFHLFGKMLDEGVKPSAVTFLVVLNTCSRTGLWSKCQTYFEAMSQDHGIIPTVEHHTCMVDLLGRTGQIDDAFTALKRIPFHSTPVLWHSILGACKNMGNVKCGTDLFEYALYLDNIESEDA